MGMLCLALMNSACTKENFLADQATSDFILSDNPLPDRTDETSTNTTVDGGVIIYETTPDTDSGSTSTTNEEETTVVDGGVELNETQPESSYLPSRCKFTHTATIQRLDCGWIMVLEDRGRLYPYKGGEGFDFEEDMQVRIAFKSEEWVSNDCMDVWGITPVELMCIEEVK